MHNDVDLIAKSILSKLQSEKLTLNKSITIVESAKKKAIQIGVNVTIAIIDDSGNLIIKQRMDNAILASINIAFLKAYTALSLQSDTFTLSKNIQSGGDLYGLQYSNNNNFCFLGGGIPIYSKDKIIGAIGVSGGSIKEDISIARYACENCNI